MRSEELSALTFDNEGGVTTGVQLPLRKRERRRATPETRGKPRTVQGQTVIETGSGKPVGFRGASERAKAMWIRSAHLHAGRRQPSMRRVNRPDTRKCLTRCPELDKGNSCVAGGRSHTKALTLAFRFSAGTCGFRTSPSSALFGTSRKTAAGGALCRGTSATGSLATSPPRSSEPLKEQLNTHRKGVTLASRFTSSSLISTMPSNADAAVKTVTPHKSKRKTAISVEPQNLCQSGYYPIDCSPRRADSPVFQVALRWFSLNGGIMQLGSSFKNCATVATEQMHMFKIEP